jgi:hypothetical protein
MKCVGCGTYEIEKTRKVVNNFVRDVYYCPVCDVKWVEEDD